MTCLAGEIALVTGASRGIGRAIALKLGSMGAIIAGTATTEKGAELISSYLKEQGISGSGYVLDVCQQTSIDKLMAALKENPGMPSILINNAGITADDLLLRMKEDQWQSVIDTNLGSIYRLSKACVRAMMKARQGRIINISSVVGISGNAGQTNYAASKAGMIGFSKSLAREIGSRGITVNTIAPGYISTDMTNNLSTEQFAALTRDIALARLGSVDDIAAAAAYLASPDAAYITGETLNVNGGLYMQ